MIELISKLFLYSGLTGHTLIPKTQLFINTYFTIFTLISIIVPYFYQKFYFTDNKTLLAIYGLTVLYVYLDCVNFFRKHNDKVSLIEITKECSQHQEKSIRLTLYLFLIVALWFQIMIPVSLYLEENTGGLQLFLSVIVGHFWACFMGVCCVFFIYLNSFCFGMASVIKKWLKSLKRCQYPTPMNEILMVYGEHYKLCKRFVNGWRGILILTFVMITFRLPFSFILVVYNNFYYEIPMLLFHIYCWFQLIVPICQLNLEADEFSTYFIKHPHIIQTREELDLIKEYTSVRRLGVNIYGIYPKYSHLLSVVIIVLNIAVPLFLTTLTNILKEKPTD